MYTRFLFLALGLLFVSCSPFSQEKIEITSLSEARSLWQRTVEQNSNRYQMEYQRVCACDFTDEVLVRVDGTTVESVFDADGDTAMVMIDDESVPALEAHPETFITVDELFDLIREVRDEAPIFDVTYDPLYGYPIFLYYDFSVGREDTEFTYLIGDLNFL